MGVKRGRAFCFDPYTFRGFPDLVAFVNIIMETNKKIAEKEKEFTDKMTAMKENLEKEVKAYYEELDKMRSESFNDRNADFERNLRPENEEKKRHRRTKAEIEAERLITNTGGTAVINTSGTSTAEPTSIPPTDPK